MKFIILFLICVGSFDKANSQVSHYELWEIQGKIDGKEKEPIDFRGKNVEIVLDLNKMILSIDKLKTSYTIKNLHLAHSDSDIEAYEGITPSLNGSDLKFTNFIIKKDHGHVFEIASINEPGNSISYVCIESGYHVNN